MESDHKLCGFLQVVLSVPSPTQTLTPGASCSLFSDGPNVGFRSDEGVLLLPLPDRTAAPPPATEDAAAATPTPERTIAAFENAVATLPSLASKRRRRKVAGLVNGSMSVVHQLQALTAYKCVKIDARVVRISARGDGEVREVVLIDLYLPIAVWSGWQFPRSGALAASLFKHARLSCCVAGHIKVTDAGQDIQETMDILVQHGLDPLSEEYGFIKNSLLNGCSCFRCEDWCRLPVITPCRHMLCLDCVALDSERCTLPGCGYPYEMQSPETIARPENPNPKWPDDWDPDWQSTSSSKVAYLVERLKVLQETNRKIGESVDGIDKTMELLYSSKANCSFLVHRKAWSTQKSESCKVLPEKVIVFSQFLEHIHVVEQQLTVAGIIFAKMYSPMHSSNKDVNAGRETFKQEGDKDEYEGTRTRRTLHNFAEKPSGLLVDSAMKLILAVIPEVSIHDRRDSLIRAGKYALTRGVTTVIDFGRFFPGTSVDHIWQDFSGRALSQWIHLGGVKAFADGSLGSSSALFYKPYEEDPYSYGLQVTDINWLHNATLHSDKFGLQVAIHAIGDKANDMVLDMYNTVVSYNGMRDRRFRIEHAQHLVPGSTIRFGEQRIIASVQPDHLLDDANSAERKIGTMRAQRGSYLFRSLIDSDAILAFGSDWPVADINPLGAIKTALYRVPPGWENAWIPSERMALCDALKASTISPAYAGFLDQELGSLSADKYADFVVLPVDSWDQLAGDLPTTVLATYVNGKQAYP
ncbi:CW-type Zinc Finger [Musa troglodytarum]|uniref:CW-type Zinc Finger n=1 Tax=Musa troglodytarum TaxID=320322 RepID=A0A9E7EMF5_9LILI|nr:CW-type Zinc Finger [Musa troglodytarum]